MPIRSVRSWLWWAQALGIDGGNCAGMGALIAIGSQFCTGVFPGDGDDPAGSFAVYLQHFIPERPTSLPVLFIHGGGLSGVQWETTPDGRPGWLTRFVAAGIPSYVLDNVGTGRAQFGPDERTEPVDKDLRTGQDAWDTFRMGRPEDFADRVLYEGSQFPIKAFDAFMDQGVPRRPFGDPLALAGILAAIDAIGECILVTHSRGAGLGITAMTQHPKIRGVIAVEPHTFPDADALPVPGPPLRIVWGDFLDRWPRWGLAFDASVALVDRARERGLDAEVVELPKFGFVGNTHNPMMEQNSDAVADLMISYVQGWTPGDLPDGEEQ